MLQYFNYAFSSTSNSFWSQIKNLLYFEAIYIISQMIFFKGELHPKRNRAYFVRYLKIINTFLKHNISTLKQICFKTFILLFKKSVDNFEIALKICSIFVWGAAPPKYCPMKIKINTTLLSHTYTTAQQQQTI